MTLERGLFITFEGGEGAGKTTQIRKLAARLPNVILTREPGGTPEGEAIRDTFVNHSGQNWPPEALVMLMFSSRIIHVENLIRPALLSGQNVLCDRFTDSTRVYQGHAGGLSLEKIEAIRELAIGQFEPDLTFILDIPPEEGLRRAGRRAHGNTFEEKDLAFHEMLRDGYVAIAKENPQRCKIVDALRDMNTIADEIFAHVTAFTPDQTQDP